MHSHSHHRAPDKDYGKVFIIGITLNLSYVCIEAFYGWYINSLALLADAGHNLSDVAGLILAWLSMLGARLLANDRRTYGWKKGTILASFFNASFLMLAMGMLAWEAIGRFAQQTQLQGEVIIWVAAAGVVVNAVTAWLFMAGSKEDLNIKGAFLHMSADTLVSLGVVLSGGLYLQWQWSWLDPVVSLVIAILVVASTWSLFRQSLHLLFDGVPEQIDTKSVALLLKEIEGVSSVHDLHIWAMSTTENALSVHLVINDEFDREQVLKVVTAKLLAYKHIDHITIQLESYQFSTTCLSRHCTG
ncbi:cation diffusion facilitator family transporter [Psychromonas sp.]|uniref:cation diffusion facilitator family transporter n=1 Tax=Psychromonas sp. TaxID=1884585 RepID=UPI00356937A4